MDTFDTEELTLQIFNKISELEKTIATSPVPRFGGADRRIVDVDELLDILGDLKITIPEDIRKANSVLVEADKISSNAEMHATELVEEAQARADSIYEQSSAKASAMIAEAEASAKQIIADAEQKREQLLSEHSIIDEAKRRAELLRKKAEYNAKMVYDNAKGYADDVLGSLMRFLEEYYAMVEVNKKDLGVLPKPDFSAPIQAARASVNQKPANNPQSSNTHDEETSLFGFLKRKKKRSDEEFDDAVENAIEG